MLRELQVTKDKPANAMYSAGEVKIITGMAVVKNETDKTFEFPESETAADLFFVDKERIPTGLNAARGDMSDYDVNFTELEEGEKGKLIAYFAGERFATDQCAEGLTIGDRVSAGTDGKLMKATASSVASKYIYKGEYNDCGHKLYIIEVSDTAVANQA